MKKFFQTMIAMCMFCLTIMSLHANDVTEKNFTVYPNPVDRGALLTIEIPEDRDEMTVLLYNTVGKVIHTYKTTNKKIEFNAPEISGIYLLRFVEKQKVINVEKIIVKE